MLFLLILPSIFAEDINLRNDCTIDYRSIERFVNTQTQTIHNELNVRDENTIKLIDEKYNLLFRDLTQEYNLWLVKLSITLIGTFFICLSMVTLTWILIYTRFKKNAR